MTDPKAPAFPVVKFDEDHHPFMDSNMQGVNVRTYIATQLMAGMISTFQGHMSNAPLKEFAELADRGAMALITQLNK